MSTQPTREPSAEMVRDIHDRLGRVCQHYPAEEFARLVRQMAAVQAKYEALRIEVFMEAARHLASSPSGAREDPLRQPYDPSSVEVSRR
jgi:hypothetical protein